MSSQSLKYWCDNFESQEMRMIKLFRIKRFMREKIMTSFPYAPTDGVSICHAARFAYIHHVSVIVL
jgi:hypothetical protein